MSDGKRREWEWPILEFRRGQIAIGYPRPTSYIAPVQTKKEIADLHFIEARCRLIELAAYLDRAQRGEGADDYRNEALRAALPILLSVQPTRAKSILEALSDHGPGPATCAASQGAFGAPLP